MAEKQGDTGFTDLPGEKGVPKNHPRIKACGALDAASCSIGLCRAAAGAELKACLLEIQKEMVTAAACASGLDYGDKMNAACGRLESRLKKASAGLKPAGAFILPGENELDARLHRARAEVRAAECACAALPDCAGLKKYLNMLSSYLFAEARKASGFGI